MYLKFRKKQLAAVILSALAALSLCACAGNKENATPTEPSTEPVSAPLPDYTGILCISELMIKNDASLLSPDGRFSDWVELENTSGAQLSLDGWQLSAGGDSWSFPSALLAPGERLLVFCDKDGTGELCANFGLSAGELLSLIAPDGTAIDSVECADMEADHVMLRAEDGSFIESRWASPGKANTLQGSAEFAAERQCASPIVINEVVVYNENYIPWSQREKYDWVELKNVSDAAQQLSEYWLSDDDKDLTQWQLPEYVLEPGQCMMVFCAGDTDGMYHAPFSLNAQDERLYLSGESGIADYVYLHDIPAGGSMGRIDGENGFFYFTASSPEAPNEGGARLISAMPRSLTEDGCYNGIDKLTVELEGEGKIYYTTDGSLPTAESTEYTAPIELDCTCVIRAISVEDGALPSRPVTYSYIINENHTLPVLSLAVDSPSSFSNIYYNGWKGQKLGANLALYDGESSFNHDCALSMKGWTSLSLPKKSMGVSFKGVYGGDLECDVFGNGITKYSSLSIRAGQDYTFSIFRNEMFQRLCSDASDAALTQASKFCILYINGEYRGIYCLKEDFSEQYYASHAGVSKGSVTEMKTPVPLDSDFYRDVIDPCWKNDMSVDENYQQLCQKVDIDSFIDWFIFESYSANTDIQGNVRVFRSDENGGKWVFALYDLDWGFCYPNDFILLMHGLGNVGNQMPTIARALSNNADFRDRLLTRFAELNKTVLSNENVLRLIDEYQALIEPEAARDRERWDLTMDGWYSRVDSLRSFINDNDWEMHNIEQLCSLLNVTPEEREAYFGR